MPALPDIDEESWTSYQARRFAQETDERIKSLQAAPPSTQGNTLDAGAPSDFAPMPAPAPAPPPPAPPAAPAFVPQPEPQPEPVAAAVSTFVPQPGPRVSTPPGPPVAPLVEPEVAPAPPPAVTPVSDDPAYQPGGTLYGKQQANPTDDPAYQRGGTLFGMAPTSSDSLTNPPRATTTTVPQPLHTSSPPVQTPGTQIANRPNGAGQIFPLAAAPTNTPTQTYHLQGGSDLMSPRGTPVLNMQSGTVDEVFTDNGSHTVGGNAVLIHGDDGLDYYYAHFDQPPAVKPGQRVETGVQIGAVGNSGNAWKGGKGETHLHLGIGHGISNGVGAEGGLGRNYNAQAVLNDLLPGIGQGEIQASARPAPTPPVSSDSLSNPLGRGNGSGVTFGAGDNRYDITGAPVTARLSTPASQAAVRQPVRVGQGQQEFVSSLQPLAARVGARTGIDPNVMIAIAANETGWGRSQTATEQNNLFSIQGPAGQASRWATYDSPEQSFEAFVDLISTSPRYKQAWADRGDPTKFVNDLRQAGYVVDEPGFPAQGWVNQVNSIHAGLPPAGQNLTMGQMQPAAPQGDITQQAWDAARAAYQSVIDAAGRGVSGATNAVSNAAATVSTAVTNTLNRPSDFQTQVNEAAQAVRDRAAKSQTEFLETTKPAAGAVNDLTSLDRRFDEKMRELGLGGNTSDAPAKPPVTQDLADAWNRYQDFRQSNAPPGNEWKQGQTEREVTELLKSRGYKQDDGGNWLTPNDQKPFAQQVGDGIADYRRLATLKRNWIEENNPLNAVPFPVIAGLTSAIADGLLDPLILAGGMSLARGIGTSLAAQAGTRVLPKVVGSKLGQRVTAEGIENGLLGAFQAAEQEGATPQDVILSGLAGVGLGMSMPLGTSGLKAGYGEAAGRLGTGIRNSELPEGVRKFLLSEGGGINIDAMVQLGQRAMELRQRGEADPNFAAPGAEWLINRLRQVLTPDAVNLVEKVDAGGVPTRITSGIRRIAAENDIPITPDTTPNDVVAGLKAKAGPPPDVAAPATAERPMGQVADRPLNPETLVEPTARPGAEAPTSDAEANKAWHIARTQDIVDTRQKAYDFVIKDQEVDPTSRRARTRATELRMAQEQLAAQQARPAEEFAPIPEPTSNRAKRGAGLGDKMREQEVRRQAREEVEKDQFVAETEMGRRLDNVADQKQREFQALAEELGNPDLPMTPEQSELFKKVNAAHRDWSDAERELAAKAELYVDAKAGRTGRLQLPEWGEPVTPYAPTRATGLNRIPREGVEAPATPAEAAIQEAEAALNKLKAVVRGEEPESLPDVLHHGTAGEFTEFDLARTGSNKDAGLFGRGAYFAVDKGAAERYGPRQLEVEHNITNPYRWPKDAGNARTESLGTKPLPADIRAEVLRRYEDLVSPTFESVDGQMDERALAQAITDTLQARGHDGVVYQNPYARRVQTEVVAFDPSGLRIRETTPRTEPPVDVTEQLGQRGRVPETPEQRRTRLAEQKETRRQRIAEDEARPNPHRLRTIGEPGETPMPLEQVEQHMDDLIETTGPLQSRIDALKEQLSRPRGEKVYAPPFMTGWSKADLIAAARSIGRSAFDDDWWGSLEPGELQRLRESNIQRPGSREPTRAELAEELRQAELDMRWRLEAGQELQDNMTVPWYEPRAEVPGELPFDAPVRSGSTREPARTPGEIERAAARARTSQRAAESDINRGGASTSHPAEGPTTDGVGAGVTDVLGGVAPGEPATARRGRGGTQPRDVEDLYGDEPSLAEWDVPGVDEPRVTTGPRPGRIGGGGEPPARPTASGGGAGRGGARENLTQITDAEGNPLRTTARGERMVVGRSGRRERHSLIAEAVSVLGAEREPIPADLPAKILKLMPNLAKMAKDAPDIAAALYYTAVNNERLMKAAQGGVQSHLVTKDLARRLGMSVEDWLQTPLGKALNAEEGYALRALLRDMEERSAQMAQEVGDRGLKNLTPIEQAAVRKQMLDMNQLQAIAVGSKSTAGRALNAHRIETDREFSALVAQGNERAAAEKALKEAKRKRDIAETKRDKLREERGEATPGQTRRERADAVLDDINDIQRERETVLENVAGTAAAKERRGGGPRMPTEVRPGERQGSQMNSSYTPEMLAANRIGNRGVPPRWRGKLSSGIAEMLSKIDDAYRQLEDYQTMSLDEKTADYLAREEARAARRAAREAAAKNAGAPERLLDALKAEINAEKKYFSGQKKAWEEMAIKQGLKEEDLALLDPTRRASDVAADLDPRYYDKVKKAAEKARAAWLEGEKRAMQREAREENKWDKSEWDRKMREYAQDLKRAKQEELTAQNRLKKAQERAVRVALTMNNKARQLLEKQSQGKVTDKMVDAWLGMVRDNDTVSMARFMRGLQDVTWWDRIGLLRYAGMLSGTVTHTAQATANAIGVGLNEVSRPVAVIFDLARVAQQRALGEQNVYRERYFREQISSTTGAWEGLKASVPEMYRMIRYGETPVHKFRDLEHQTSFGADQILGGRLGRAAPVVDFVAETPLRVLAAGDIFFRNISRGAEIRANAYNRAREEGYNGWAAFKRSDDIMQDLVSFPELVDTAEKRAARVVTQEERDEINAVLRFTKTPLGAVFKTVAFPFVRTPINVAAQGIGLTPMGYVGALRSASRSYGRDLTESQMRAFRDEATDRAARATLGTAIMAMAATQTDNMTGAAPVNDSERNTLPPNWQPWSYRFDQGNGNTVYVRYSNMGAVGFPLAVMAILGNEARSPTKGDNELERWTKRAGTVVSGVADYVEGQTMLQGLAQLLNAPKYGDAPNYLTGLGINWLTSHVPYGALQRQIDRATGMADRDITNKPLDELMAGRVPGQLSSSNVLTYESGPSKLDPLGRPVVSGQSGFGAFLSPGRYTISPNDEVLAALRENDVNLPDPPDTYANMRLTAPEKRDYQMLSGEYVQQRVQSVIYSPSYQTASDATRQRMLNAAISSARTAAGAAFARSIGESGRRERLLEERERNAPVPRVA